MLQTGSAKMMATVFTESPRALYPQLAKAAERTLPPALALLAFILAWQLGTGWLGIPKYLLPAPSDLLVKFVTDRGLLASSFVATGYVAIVGFAVATLVAIPLGLAIASYSSLRRDLLPLIVCFDIIPKTITAPLLIVWFGFGFTPRIALTAVMTFFPILVNSVAGFSAINPRLHLITKSLGASLWQTFILIRLPAAMPYIFAGFKVGVVHAVAASLTAEFISANEGLEVLILSASSDMDTPLMFAGVAAAATLAMLLSSFLLGLEKIIMPWRSP
ncbi:hypothetical protein AU467_31645 [Mesorhizobium loti]|uniref:ABC transmembrane type-1 domain-containing protein n=1 Tax=Rhizobium loti TaxID=381 RepID=A0A101KNF8_RHILI|nr:hypothetical protein AU467_31645 [Mesorhizobium loti]